MENQLLPMQQVSPLHASGGSKGTAKADTVIIIIIIVIIIIIIIMDIYRQKKCPTLGRKYLGSLPCNSN